MNRYTPLFAIAALLLGCGNAGEDLGFGIGQAPGLNVVVYFDRDWSGDSTDADTTKSGISVSLTPLNNVQALATDTTNAEGLVRFRNIDPGYYRLVVDSAVLGDTVVAMATPAVDTLRAGSGTREARIGIAPPVFTMPQVRTGPIGKIVIVAATVTAGRQVYTDRSTFVRDAGTGALRLRHVVNLNGIGVNDPGDIVRIRGRISVYNGQIILDSARVHFVDSRTPYLPDTLTTGAAAVAGGGPKDARLVHVVAGTILDTGTVAGQFQVGLDDGSGRLVMQVDTLVSVLTSPFIPGKQVDATGALAATGAGSWELWPRDVSDYLIH